MIPTTADDARTDRERTEELARLEAEAQVELEERRRLTLQTFGVQDDGRPSPGARWLELNRARFFGRRTTLAEDGTGRIDPYRTIYHEGQRSIFLLIEADLRAARREAVGPTAAQGEATDGR